MLIGALIYQIALSVATAMDWSDQLKLIMSALFVLVMMASNVLDKGRRASRD